MKTSWLIGLVILAHGAAVLLVVMIPGCGTTLPVDTQETMVVYPPKVLDPVPVRTVAPVVFQPVVPELATTYVVASGDTLSKIASRHGLHVNDIMALNDLKNKNVIRVGQKLQLPAASATDAVVAPRTGIVPVTPAVQGPVYEVRKGDSLSVIAVAHGVKTQEIMAANGLTSDRILVGQKLTIPGGKKIQTPVVEKAPGTPVKAPVEKPVQAVQPVSAVPVTSGVRVPADKGASTPHTVAAGEDVTSIAMMWGVSPASIREANKLSEEAQLKPGQTINIPLTD